MTLPKLSLSLAIVVLSSGCSLLGGGGLLPSVGGSIGGPKYGPYDVTSGVPIGRGKTELKIQTSIDVPPERGSIAIGINAHGGTYDAAAAQMTTAFADLKKIGTTSGCGWKVGHYDPPFSKDNLKWKTGGSAEIWADTTGLDADARFARINVCYKALREYVIALPKYDTNTAEGFEVSAGAALGPDIVWSVQALDKHRDTLVTQADARLKAVEKASAKAWDHADTQCTSGGVVEVASVSSHFITLTLEMNCPVAAPENATRVKAP